MSEAPKEFNMGSIDFDGLTDLKMFKNLICTVLMSEIQPEGVITTANAALFGMYAVLVAEDDVLVETYRTVQGDANMPFRATMVKSEGQATIEYGVRSSIPDGEHTTALAAGMAAVIYKYLSKNFNTIGSRDFVEKYFLPPVWKVYFPFYFGGKPEYTELQERYKMMAETPDDH